MSPVDYSYIALYLLLMVVIGFKTRHSSANISDYVRMGNKSTWWMNGLSQFMLSFSAATFTGIAGNAFIAGWSLVITTLCGALGFFIQAAYFGPVFRRTRAITPLDAVRSRFGPVAEQLKVYISTFTSFFYAGFFLLGFATFASALLPIPMWSIVVVMGAIVVFYSVTGGSWSVQITDSIQALILLSVTVAFTILCLHKTGGFGGLLEGIRAAGLSQDFAWIKPMDYEYSADLPVRRGNFTSGWIVASILGAITGAVNINVSYRYLSLTDEKSAQKSAFFAGCLMLVGCFIWYIPPIVGRLYYAEDIFGVTGIANPADAAYAVTAMKLLPSGMVGLIFVCMLAATMSSMDSFLTGTAGFIVRNLIEPLRRAIGADELSAKGGLQLTRIVNLGLGLWAIVMAFVLQRIGGDSGMFGVVQTLVTLIGGPVAIPFALSLIMKRIPLWGLFSGIGCGSLASAYFFYQREALDVSHTWAVETIAMTIVCIVPTALSAFFWRWASPAMHERTEKFFTLIRTPINVAEEVGETIDNQLLETVGFISAGTGLAFLPILFFCETPTEWKALLGITSFLVLLGGFMIVRGRAKQPTRARQARSI